MCDHILKKQDNYYTFCTLLIRLIRNSNKNGRVVTPHYSLKIPIQLAIRLFKEQTDSIDQGPDSLYI